MSKIFEKGNKSLIALGLIGIALLCSLIYSNIIHAPFVFDDHISIKENDSIRSIAESFKKIATNRYLVSLSFAMNYSIGGLKPFGYHLINNIIHVINALLVYYLVVLTFKTPYFSNQQSALSDNPPSSPLNLRGDREGLLSSYFIAFSSAFIFISHPIQTQAVTYIAQRATSMATMFYLISLVMYIKFRLQVSDIRCQVLGNTEPNKTLNLKPKTWYLCSVISAVLAMKTKEIAFTLPLVIALYEFSFFSKAPNYSVLSSTMKRFFYLLPILLTILIIPLSMMNFKATMETITQDINIQSRETVNIARTDYLLTQFRVIVTYLRLLIMPVNQSLDYSYPVYHSFLDLQVFLSFVFLLLIFGAAVYLFYASRVTHHVLRLTAFGIFWFFITLSVESSIIPIRDVIVEHRLYLPSIGFFIAAVLSVEYLFSNMRLKIALMLIIVSVLSISTYNRNTIWKDPQALWEDVIAKSPNNARAYNNLGVEFKNKREFDKAIEQLEKSLKADKNYTTVYFNLGDIQYRLGNYENAVAYLKLALGLKLEPQLHLDILNKLGRTYSARGHTEDAIKTFMEAISLFPKAIAPYNNLGIQYVKIGELDLAIETFEKALQIRDEPYLRANLSIAYAKKVERDKDVGTKEK